MGQFHTSDIVTGVGVTVSTIVWLICSRWDIDSLALVSCVHIIVFTLSLFTQGLNNIREVFNTTQ